MKKSVTAGLATPSQTFRRFSIPQKLWHILVCTSIPMQLLSCLVLKAQI